MNGFDVRTLSAATNQLAWMWKRAKGFMDVVAYSGTGSARTVPHSLGVAPEMMWVKSRSHSENWMVYTDTSGANKYIYLNSASAPNIYNTWNGTAPTDSVFSLSNIDEVNGSGKTYIAYLFATLAGISKVGSYTGNGSNNHVIDCGFTNGARFVLTKRISGSGQWYLFDSVRGITVGSTDPFIMLNLNNAQQTEAAGMGPDTIQPHSSGFQLTTGADLNDNGHTFIFYAIA
tara:strand:- start:281 stop:973 length:693 start_codon:yes stop_codon:yes gene_type:complete